MSSRLLNLTMMLALCAGCGTVVGNPKKPKDEPKSDAIVFKLPELELTVPSGATSDDASLLLDDAIDNGDKTLLTSWAKRLDKSVQRVNNLSRRVNKILDKKEDDVENGVLVFKNRGDDGQVSGKIQTLPEGGDYAFQAVLCYGGQLLSELKWTADEQRLELTRDFSVKSVGEDDSFALVSTLKIQQGETLQLDLASQGNLEDGLVGTDGAAFTESSHVERDAGKLTVRTVADSQDGTDFPADGAYEGDRYLVGQVTDTGSEFVGFFKGFALPCQNGFDEEATDLWHPGAGRPRFCVGRPAGANHFKTILEYYSTLERLQAIGVQKKAELRAVKFADGLSCE